MIRPVVVLLVCAIPAFATSLSELLDEAASNNPDIAAAMQAWRAAERVPSQVAALPDPQVSFQQQSVGSPRPFAGYTNSDFAYLGFGISQDIPYPGKLTLRSEAARKDADMTRDRYEAVRRAVFLQVKESYIQIASLQKTLDVLQRDRALLSQVAQITEARYRLGQGTQQDVLKAQLQMTKLLNEIAEHHRLMDTEQALMNKILNRMTGEVRAGDLSESPLTFSSDELLARVRQENPEVLGSQEAVNRKSLQIEIAGKDRYPDFSVQYQWDRTGDRFRDYYMLTFSAKLPIYRRKKLDPAMTQAVEEMNQSRREYESRVQQAYFDVRDQYIAATTASEMLKISREGLIPQALATFRAGLTAYQAGTEDFASLLSSFLDVLNFDEEYWKTLADHETALARLEQLTGAAIR